MRVIITGAGTGIGQATARRLAREGAQLLLVGRRKLPLQELAEELSVDFATCDVAETGAMEKSSRDFAEKHGGIDGLVANAGINPQRADALHAEDSFWEETLKVNLTGTHRSCRAVLPYMTSAKKGAIVTVGSIAGLAGMKARAAYGSSKAAVVNYTQSLAVDYGEQGIRANCVCPGFVITDINRAWLKELPAERLAALEERHLLGLGTPDAVADAIAFLLSDAARWITGVALPVDGGWRAH
ncbi:MAG: SDR family NAD(P)-dependent oxidoreductase [Planctomycetota bacterium]|nr:SDR family NAD(P)-dependent oxidoreductase [Planctomycetota bacterium]